MIDGAKAGSTITFLGFSYENISLTINKALNIVSKVGTVLHGSSNNVQGTSSSAVFYFKEGSAGSNISGFNIIADDYGIYVKNTSNIKISNNNISNSSKSAIDVANSKNIGISSNNIRNNNDGIIIENSNKSTISNNNIKNNKGNGLYLSSTKDSVVTKNNVESNDKNGISLRNTLNTNVTSNVIYKNKISGIELNGKTQNTYIAKNNISKSNRGIFINSDSKGDSIVSNNIRNNEENDYEDEYVSGVGILFGNQYNDKNKEPLIKNNAFYQNSRFSIKASMDSTKLKLGSNWFGSNDPTFWGLCPKIQSNGIIAKLIGSKLVFYDGTKIATDLAPFGIWISLNGGPKVYLTVTNGVAEYNKPFKISQNNIFHAFFDRDDLTYLIAAINNNGNNGNGPGGNGPGGNGVGGIGNGLGNAAGNGLSTLGITGPTSDPANSGSSSSGDDANTQTAQKQSPQAKEIFIDDNNILKMDDTRVLTGFIIILLFGSIIIGYIVRNRTKENSF